MLFGDTCLLDDVCRYEGKHRHVAVEEIAQWAVAHLLPESRRDGQSPLHWRVREELVLRVHPSEFLFFQAVSVVPQLRMLSYSSYNH